MLPPNRPLIFKPGDRAVCCHVCRNTFGIWPAGAGEWPAAMAHLSLYCRKPRCRQQRHLVVIDPPAERIAA